MTEEELENLFKEAIADAKKEIEDNNLIYDSAINFALKNINKNTEYKVDKPPYISDYEINYDDIIADELNRQNKIKSNKISCVFAYLAVSFLIFTQLCNLSNRIIERIFISLFFGLFSFSILQLIFREYQSDAQDKFKQYIADFIAYK